MDVLVKIISIHVCTDGKTYVQREDQKWYLTCQNEHHFCEVDNWNEDYWKAQERSLPCSSSEHLEVRDILLSHMDRR